VFSLLENSILKTIAYFDIFSRPLKEKEILDNLVVLPQNLSSAPTSEISIEFIKKEIENSQYLPKFIEKKNDFYFLKGREDIIKERQKREKISQRNWQKLEKIAKKINFAPFLKGVFVSGSLAINNSNEKSDIDLMIIAKKGRIFTVRFFLISILDFIGERRTAQKKAGKICLNHYLTDDNLEINFPSVYNAYTYLHLKPIINRGQVFENFRKENEWMKNYLLFWDKKFSSPFKIEYKSDLAKFLEKVFGGNFGNKLEEKLKKEQLKRKEKNYPEGVKNGRVILKDTLIELHPNSPEKKILKEYQKRLQRLSLS